MSSGPKTTILSRFFDANTLLVAGTCSRCHRGNTDVKIIAVNRRFLRQVERLKRETSGDLQDILTSDHWVESGKENGACVICLRPFNKINVHEESQQQDEVGQETVEFETAKFAHHSKYFTRKTEGDDVKDFVLNFVPVWHPPKSPHNLIEEDLYADPWALLVATIFLNKTSCATARSQIEWFLSDFRNPFAVLQRDPSDLEKYFVAIGLKKRAGQVWRMSHDFVHKDWKDVGELYGIGSYGRDAFNMFCLGRMHSVEPKDRFLRIYKAWFELLESEEEKKKIACGIREELEGDESEDSGFGCSPQEEDGCGTR